MYSKTNKLKVFFPQGSKNYGNWIPVEWEQTENVLKADLIFFEGGSDVSPSLYGERAGSRTLCNWARDEYEEKVYKIAKQLNIKCVGTCRGLQLLTIMNGGTLIQDVNHHSGYHLMHTFDGKSFEISSTHHQQGMVDGVMDPEDYHLLGWTTHRSDYHKNGYDEDMALAANYKEVEMIYFNKSGDFCWQWHPEFMDKNSEAIVYLQSLFMDYLENKGIFNVNQKEKSLEQHGVA